MLRAGHRAAMLYIIPRSDGAGFRAAHEIDPDYAETLRFAAADGVEVYARSVKVAPDKTCFNGSEEWANIY